MKKINVIMLNTITLLLIPILLLVIYKCEINTSPISSNNNDKFHMYNLTVDELYDLIYGKWNWIYSIVMQRGLHPPDNMITPDSVGYTFQRIFKNNNEVDSYKNDQYSRTQSFYIDRFKILETDSGYVTEIYIDSSGYQLRFLHPDTMMIGNGWSDGVDQYYVRTN